MTRRALLSVNEAAANEICARASLIICIDCESTDESRHVPQRLRVNQLPTSDGAMHFGNGAITLSCVDELFDDVGVVLTGQRRNDIGCLSQPKRAVTARTVLRVQSGAAVRV